ncbi:Uncharacterised protein [Vibrio cholerae]|nr:Uncharacterised protein [Vibrio cholerae]
MASFFVQRDSVATRFGIGFLFCHSGRIIRIGQRLGNAFVCRSIRLSAR